MKLTLESQLCDVINGCSEDVVDNTETLDYDAGNFLAAVGGNLGLLLGLSGLSVLFYFIKWLKRYQIIH